MDELELGMNNQTNRIVGGFLIVEFIGYILVTVACLFGIFQAEVFYQVIPLLIAGIPGAVLGILTLTHKKRLNVIITRNVMCVLMCIQTFVMAFFAYSYAGSFSLLIPIDAKQSDK